MNKKLMTLAVAAFAAFGAFAYQVSVGTYVVNAGKTVTVPVALDSAAGLSYASAKLTYDPQVLVVTKAEAGSLKALMSEDFVATDTNGVVSVAIFGSTKENVASGSGTIALVTFAVRAGTEGLYSDVTVTDVELGEKTGVKDVTVGNPLTTQSGMVRVMSASAAVARLENAETVVAETALGSLALKAGDALQASGDQTKPIAVAGAVTSVAAAIPVTAPVNGWASGCYALLSTTSAGLTLALNELPAETTVVYSNAVVAGVTTYYATLSIAGEIAVEPDGDLGETLTAEAQNQIRANAQAAFAGKSDADSLAKKALYESAKKIKIAGPKGKTSLIADMGLSPAFAPALDPTGTLLLTYAEPKLEVTAFDSKTGAVRFKVTPGAGNQIVSEIATGYVHVYGTNDLSEKMKYISSVGFDLTPYLKQDTKGEGVLNVTLGSHTFLKVKIENVSKKEGDAE